MKEGAVVVLDSRTGDIEAMVSLPLYNPEADFPQRRGVEQPGVAGGGAWLYLQDSHRSCCSGSRGNVTGRGFLLLRPIREVRATCLNGKGHGALTLAQGFAVSCNTVFAALAERLSGAQLQCCCAGAGTWQRYRLAVREYPGTAAAKAAGRGAAGDDFHHLLPDDSGARVQTAIGQRDVQDYPASGSQSGSDAAAWRGGKSTAYTAAGHVRQRPDAEGSSGTSVTVRRAGKDIFGATAGRAAVMDAKGRDRRHRKQRCRNTLNGL
jgi:hypothetical protein